jgi:hypothetical protein
LDNSKIALASGPKLYKTIDKQITDITGNNLNLDFIFETVEALTRFVKTDESKVLDDLNRIVILDGAFNSLHTPKHKALAFLLLQNLLKDSGYTKVNLVLLTNNSELRLAVESNNSDYLPFCYSNTEVLLASKVGLKLLAKVLNGDYVGTGLQAKKVLKYIN